MDPLTQSALGATAALAFTCKAPKETLLTRAVAGLIGGILPDLDVIIRSHADPMLSIEYHRSFTHALIMIPVGGFVAAFLYWFITQYRHSFRTIWIAATIGYATHGLLDACTSYGTLLYWPFSSERVAWDLVAIVDPFFTLPLVLGSVIAVLSARQHFARLALVFCAFYLGLCAVQHHLATNVQRDLAHARGHVIERARTHPFLGSPLLWRSIYEANGELHIDAIRTSPLGGRQFCVGGSVPKFDLNAVIATLPHDAVLRRDLTRYSWFADDYLALIPNHSTSLGDFRYGRLPQSMEPLWGIRFDLTRPNAHVERLFFREASLDKLNTFWHLLRGREPCLIPLPKD